MAANICHLKERTVTQTLGTPIDTRCRSSQGLPLSPCPCALNFFVSIAYHKSQGTHRDSDPGSTFSASDAAAAEALEGLPLPLPLADALSSSGPSTRVLNLLLEISSTAPAALFHFLIVLGACVEGENETQWVIHTTLDNSLVSSLWPSQRDT